MKTIIALVLALGSLTATLSAKAAILPGQVTGYGMLGCMVTNFTGQAQILDYVQYHYTCNHGPHDPFHTYFTTIPCYGLCEVPNGRSFWHNNGPFTYNCMLLNSSCQGWAHPAPTPVPTATPTPTP